MTLPRKTDRVSRGRGHPTTAEGWIALPATLPRKDKVSRGRGHPTTQRVGLHCLRPSQERTGFQEDGDILLRRELDCIACDPPKKGQGFKRTGTSYYAESWITLPATLPRKMDRVSRGPGHPTTAESWIALPATLPRKTDMVSRGLRTSYYCRELDRIACGPPKKDGQGFKRTGASYYCRELEGFVSCRRLGALPTPSSMTTPHPAP